MGSPLRPNWRGEIQSLIVRLGQILARDFNIQNHHPAGLSMYLINQIRPHQPDQIHDLERSQRLAAVTGGYQQENSKDRSK